MIKPYINFEGDCEEAFNLYVRAFDGKIEYMQKYGELPADPASPMDEAIKDKVMHAEIRLTEKGGIAGGDATWPYDKGGAVNMLVRFHPRDEEKARRAWVVLAEGGEITMDLVRTDYAVLQGALKDRFGFTWIFNVTDWLYEYE